LKRVLRFFGNLMLWLGPLFVTLLVLATGFIAWMAATPQGTRWMLELGTRQIHGQINGVEGTLWSGLRVHELSFALPVVKGSITDLRVQVDWRALMDRRLHARNISVAKLDIDVLQSDQPPSDAPFSVPALPVRLALDRVALDQLTLRLNGAPFLLNVQNLQAALALSDEDASLVFQSLRLGRDDISADIEGELKVFKLADPWPMSVHLKTNAHTAKADSPLCLRHFLPDLPAPVRSAAPAAGQDGPAAELARISTACAVDVIADLTGSFDGMDLKVGTIGQDVRADISAHLQPRELFMLRNGTMSVHLADGSSLTGLIDWKAAATGGDGRDRVTGRLAADKLNLGLALGPEMPAGMVTASVDFDAVLHQEYEFESAGLKLEIADGSRWNGQALGGRLQAKVAAPVDQALALSGPSPATLEDALTLRLSAFDMDLRLGKDRIAGQGALNEPGARLNLDVALSRLDALWPGLPGGLQAKMGLGGTVSSHEVKADLVYAITPGKESEIGKGPVQVRLDAAGGWAPAAGAAGLAGWRGRLAALDVRHAGLGARLREPMPLSFSPSAVAPDWQWQAGAASLDVTLPQNQTVTIAHKGSRGRGADWETSGGIGRLAMSRRMLRELGAALGRDEAETQDRGRIVVKMDPRVENTEIVYAADWNLKSAGALAGTAHVRRLSGDLIVPADPEFPLGLEKLELTVEAKPTGAGISRLTADVDVATAKMGQGRATATVLVRSTPGGGFTVDPRDLKTLVLDAEVRDLGWLGIFAGDAMDIGGAVKAHLRAQSRPDGTWATQGTMTGTGIRVVRVDDGVRLLDGTLAAHFDNERFILDSLRFPARLRVKPKEWRTATWVSEDPDAKNGALTLSGIWDMTKMAGKLDIDFHRYPILQRSDRYAMVTGKLEVDAPTQALSISGELVADAGWIDLDMLSSVPTVDGDVVVLRKGQKKPEPKAPMDLSMDLSIDLGPRFYITGYGVDSGLIGKLRLLLREGKMTGEGILRTRGGAIDVYGQHLQLRRGSITFQGDITNPVLNIEALRTGLPVEAGVRVAGTPRRPRIDLVSYPEVSDVQKLSWLLLGRGPDDSGGDAALLFSVGTSLLTGGEPFYRKFGLDEVTMRSGELGSTGSVLPAQSVVRDLDQSGASDLERRFVSASKQISKGFTVSLEQSLSQTGTVGRLSYQLARGLTAELSVGTVNGIALIYRTFFRE